MQEHEDVRCDEIVSLNIDDLDVEALEQRLEMAALNTGLLCGNNTCGKNCWDCTTNNCTTNCPADQS
jgi:hypothetical protein